MRQAMNIKSAAPKEESVSSYDAFQALIQQPPLVNDDSYVCGVANGSGYCQIIESYEKWAEQRPKTLPESKGWTEENAAWLHMKYSGKLSPHELMDAVDSMRRMKIISRDEQNAIYGGKRIIHPLKDCLKIEMIREVTDETDLHPPTTFDEPLAYCNTLDDILQYFKNRRETEPIFEDWYLKDYYAGKLIALPEGEDLQPDDTEILKHLCCNFSAVSIKKYPAPVMVKGWITI